MYYLTAIMTTYQATNHAQMANFIHGFYRAMHFSTKRGIAIACRLSVRLSVRPSVCDVGEL